MFSSRAVALHQGQLSPVATTASATSAPEDMISVRSRAVLELAKILDPSKMSEIRGVHLAFSSSRLAAPITQHPTGDDQLINRRVKHNPARNLGRFRGGRKCPVPLKVS